MKSYGVVFSDYFYTFFSPHICAQCPWRSVLLQLNVLFVSSEVDRTIDHLQLSLFLFPQWVRLQRWPIRQVRNLMPLSCTHIYMCAVLSVFTGCMGYLRWGILGNDISTSTSLTCDNPGRCPSAIVLTKVYNNYLYFGKKRCIGEFTLRECCQNWCEVCSTRV